MDSARFDQLSRLAGQPSSRRAALGLAAALGLGPLVPASGRRRRNRCRGGCGACRVCQRRRHMKRCVIAPDGTACTGGTCRAGTCCLPDTCASLGLTCGPATDGCGGDLACGTCGTGGTPACNSGTCATCAATCAASCTLCYHRPDGATVCGNPSTALCASPCSSDADCPGTAPVCATSYTERATNVSQTFSSLCGSPVPAVCVAFAPC